MFNSEGFCIDFSFWFDILTGDDDTNDDDDEDLQQAIEESLVHVFCVLECTYLVEKQIVYRDKVVL